MDAETLVRAARQHASLGQAPFARLAGVSERALSGLEAGRVDPRWSTVARLVEAAGLELVVVPVLPDPSPHLVRHLRASMSARLHLTLTATATATVCRGCSPVCRELAQLAATAEVWVDGVAAAGVWIPGVPAPTPLPVTVHGRPVLPQADLEHLAIRVGQSRPPAGGVAVQLGRWRVRVPPPLVLAAHPACQQLAAELRAAAALLAATPERDDAGRRAAAHREPDEWREAEEVLHRRRHDGRALPSRQDSRAWRVGGQASLTSWLRAHPQ